MYIIHVHQHHAMCQKKYHPWNISIICLCQYANMCIYQYANHVNPPIYQPCETTNMTNMCIYQHDKQCIISLMICLHHEPSIITMYQTNTNCCANQLYCLKAIIKQRPYMSVPKHLHHHAPIPQND